MTIRIKKILLGSIVLLLFLPMIQSNFHVFRFKKLNGDFIPAQNISISFPSWWSKKFQEQKEKYLNDHFGLREDYIRIYNQLVFTVFKKSNANGVTIGKENCLFEQGYIDSYYGKNYIGLDSIQKRMYMVSYLKDTFEKLDKTLLLVFAPGKAFYYPEFIPDQKTTAKGITNIEVYLRLAKELNIPHIDFHTWFIQNKTTSPYPLIPKYGIHWSEYGAFVAMDSMIKKIESLRNIDMMNTYNEKMWLGGPSGQDMDIEKGMNIWFRLKPEILAYPEVRFEDSTGKVKPSIITIADSYYWQMMSYGIATCFKRSDFWYYFKRAHNASYGHSKPINEINVVEEVDHHDVIVIMASDINLPDFGWNFIETMFEHYQGKLPDLRSTAVYHEQIMELKLIIESDSNWMSSVRKKALEKGIPADSMAYIDAKYVIDQKK